MKKTLTIISLLFSIFIYGQATNDTIQVLAKLLEYGVGNKVYFAKYEVIKSIKGFATNDTIGVGYYFYKETEDTPQIALLKIVTTNIKDYYTFPDYDPQKGTEPVELSYIDLDYWENCKTGKSKYTSLTIYRNSDEKHFLILPCGGTETTVTLFKEQRISKQKENIQTQVVSHSECPPIFEITHLKDGKYFIYIHSCGIGGQIEINLKTK